MALFGFEQVEDWVKTKRVHDLFSRVTNSYDIMNDLMSLGIHRYWKDYFVKNLTLHTGERVLDVASGTGDITRKILETYPFLNLKITATDLTESMLNLGRDKSINHGILNVEYKVADAENLPFEDESFDAYTISFGMRNIGNMEKALSEAYRILKPGGRFYCLEFSHVDNEYVKMAYDLYSKVIPHLGGVVANDEKAYQYLVDSIRSFPSQEAFKDMITNASFENASFENLTFGVVAIHHGKKS